jgi:NAD(P)-dependent dehydrogenase (short-subunit alcohol dehydrogenase family)
MLQMYREGRFFANKEISPQSQSFCSDNEALWWVWLTDLLSSISSHKKNLWFAGQIDMVFCNAGVGTAAVPIAEMSLQNWNVSALKARSWSL